MFEILVRLIERAEQARRLNETAWILVFRPRCTPAVLNSHPRGLSDYSLVKEQGRLSDTFASRRSTSHSRANVGSNCRYRRRDAPHQPSFPCGEAESYRPACRCQRLSNNFLVAQLLTGSKATTLAKGSRLSWVLQNFATGSRRRKTRRSSGTAADVSRGFEPNR